MESLTQIDSWNNFRIATISGDMNSIKVNHADKDFRVLLQTDQSALDLAARNGHTDLVKYFLDALDQFTNRKSELSRVLSTALRDACKGRQMDMVKFLIQELRDCGGTVEKSCAIPGDECRLFISLCSIACKKIEIFNLVKEFYADCNLAFNRLQKLEIVSTAFETGSSEILSNVIEYLGWEVSGVVVPAPECFMHCALGNEEEVREEVRTSEDWYSVRETGPAHDAGPWHEAHTLGNFDRVYSIVSHHRNVSFEEPFPGMRLVGVAARFGHLQLLKELLEQIPAGELESSLNEVILQAWSTDQLEVVQWLNEFRLIELKPPHTYLGINVFGTNRVFHYMRDNCPSLDGIDLLEHHDITMDLSIGYNAGVFGRVQNEASLEVIEYYVTVLGLGLCCRRWEALWNKCVRCACPNLAMMLMRMWSYMVTSCVGSDTMYDYLVCDVLSFGCLRRPLHCLPVMEILLEKLLPETDVGRACTFLWMLLKQENDTRSSYSGMTFDNDHGFPVSPDLPLELSYSAVHSATSYLLKRGAVIDYPLLQFVVSDFIHKTVDYRPMLVRSCTVLDFADATLTAQDHGLRFKAPFFQAGRRDEDLDICFRSTLLGLLGCKYTTIDFPGLLSFLLRVSDDLRKVYIDLITFLGIVIVDSELEGVDNARSKPAYNEVISLSHSRVHALSGMARNTLLRLIRNKQEVLRGRGEIYDFRESVTRFVSSHPEISSMPNPLQKLFKLPPVPKFAKQLFILPEPEA